MTAVTSELALILRTWRERLPPQAAGLPANVPRRTNGLRREELAVLAGVSADYIVRLEQGRASAPSAPVCGALARALQLSDVEQDHLFRLAGHAPVSGRISSMVPAGLRRMIDRLDDRPIAVFDAMWTIVVWNRLWAALLGDPSELPSEDRNLVWRHFTGSPARITPVRGYAQFEASLVADLRWSTGRYPDDQRLRTLVTRLREASEPFRRCWESREVAEHQPDSKVIDHPDVGQLVLDCEVLSTQRNDLRLVMYTAEPDSESDSRLRLLAAIGTQRMRP